MDVDGHLALKWKRSRRVLRLLRRDGGKCSICGSAMLFEQWHKDKPNFATIDHIRPRSKGGSNDLKNCRLACRLCNSMRGNHYEEHMGGIRASAYTPPRAVRLDAHPKDITLWYRCSRCDTRYAVFGWQNKAPNGLCPLCDMQ